MRGLVVTFPIRFDTHGASHVSREAEREQSLALLPGTPRSGPGARQPTVRIRISTVYTNDPTGKAAMKKTMTIEAKALNQSAFYIIADTIAHKPTLQHIERDCNGDG